MGQQDLISGKTLSSRPKTSFTEYMRCRGITEDLAPAEKMERLHQLFGMFAASTRAISDNLQPGECERRLQDTQIRITKDQMVKLLDENIHAVDLMRACIEEMARCPLSQVNGTSVDFPRCSDVYHEEEKRLEVGKQELTSLLHLTAVTDFRVTELSCQL